MGKDFGKDDFFSDDFDDAFKMMGKLLNQSQSMGSTYTFSESDGASNGVDLAWSEDDKGKILTIKLKDKNNPIDVDVKDGMISIKGKVMTKTESGSSMRTFSQSQSVPAGVDGSKVQISASDNNIVMKFPWGASGKAVSRVYKKPFPKNFNRSKRRDQLRKKKREEYRLKRLKQKEQQQNQKINIPGEVSI